MKRILLIPMLVLAFAAPSLSVHAQTAPVADTVEVAAQMPIVAASETPAAFPAPSASAVAEADSVALPAPDHRITVGKVAGIAVPAAMFTYGLISLGNNGIRRLDYDLRDDIAWRDAFWHISADDYLVFGPAAIAAGLKLCGVESAHGWLDMAAIYALGNGVALGVAYGVKFAAGRTRPDGSDGLSFPSAHTTAAFVAAEFLHQEYKDKSVWISVTGYSVATFVGAARIMKNRHWLSDVVAGAGLGILSTKAVYWGYPYLRKALFPRLGSYGFSGENTSEKQTSFTLQPTYYYTGQMGLSLCYIF